MPERIETADFVPTLERIRDVGSEAVAELIPELADDIAAYRVATPEPLRTRVGELEVLTTPAPSAIGGAAAALRSAYCFTAGLHDVVLVIGVEKMTDRISGGVRPDPGDLDAAVGCVMAAGHG